MRASSFSLSVLLLTLLLVLSGCLPTGCQREEPTGLFPADSLSRSIAEGLVPDTVQHVQTTAGPDDAPLELPRTVQIADDGTIYVADVQHDRIYVFDNDGTFTHTWDTDDLDIPYLVGMHGDTLAVYNIGAQRVDRMAEETTHHSVPLPVDDLPRSALTYTAAGPSAVYLKVADEDAGTYIKRLDEAGDAQARATLPGMYWRHAGLLRIWGDDLLSLSGFRPLIDRVPLDFADGATTDSLHLTGFNSPMLERSRGFVVSDDVSEPPLLTPSAAPAGDRLFVLNIRPGWLHVDVFDRYGTLQHMLQESTLELDSDYYPRDVAVQQRPDGSYTLAVVFSDPEPQLEVYRWDPPADPLAADTESR